ncbi:uncharacterized protein A1O5_03078 [Cladophialophora psammophila CBS 110553]|uniref:2EXR domain-containing protein n=1 Tax=Cladophialophora psammophila CBS 110553 TaxID=1182543 RepID=W9WZE3_9EURO|nr:uncharacterized protein A1O5_03078 [Cladophialophora psammophila CBS 110553]EXJ73318.1 hypothetical protein A1O5_03078 [Cladophialophora psammophila CBS 110553]
MTSFLNLPPELRQNIYDFSLPVQQLKVQDFYDPGWPDAEKPAGIPSLFFVNKAVSEEAAAAFYSRAVLNVAPLRPASYLFDSLTGNGPKLNLAFGLDVKFSSCPRRHLQRITTARIYSGQHDAISAEAYEALLRWLVDNTAVQMIHLSRRLMTRLRRARADSNATFDLRAAATSETRLPGIQIYVLEKGGENDALLDPRWDARSSDDNQRRAVMHNISGWLDSLLAGDPAAEQKGRAEDEPRLYQVCFVFPHSQPSTG